MIRQWGIGDLRARRFRFFFHMVGGFSRLAAYFQGARDVAVLAFQVEPSGAGLDAGASSFSRLGRSCDLWCAQKGPGGLCRLQRTAFRRGVLPECLSRPDFVGIR